MYVLLRLRSQIEKRRKVGSISVIIVPVSQLSLPSNIFIKLYLYIPKAGTTTNQRHAPKLVAFQMTN